MRDLDELNDYHELQQWLSEYCEAARHPGWHNYGPSELKLYQADPVKILLVGAESYGYSGNKNVPPNEYLCWIRDRHRTPHYSSVFIAFIREYIELLKSSKPIPPYKYAQWRKYYYDDNLLIERMKPTIYTNARITSNGTGSTNEDKQRILSDVKEFAAFRKRFIEIMLPRIVICAGISSINCIFNDCGAFPKSALQKVPVFIYNNIIFVLIAHLSRPSAFGGYQGLHDIAVQCANIYVGGTGPLQSSATKVGYPDINIE